MKNVLAYMKGDRFPSNEKGKQLQGLVRMLLSQFSAMQAYQNAIDQGLNGPVEFLKADKVSAEFLRAHNLALSTLRTKRLRDSIARLPNCYDWTSLGKTELRFFRESSRIFQARRTAAGKWNPEIYIDSEIESDEDDWPR